MPQFKEIHSPRMAKYLTEQGCTLVRIIPNIYDMSKRVWIFENSELLKTEMTKFSNKRQED